MNEDEYNYGFSDGWEAASHRRAQEESDSVDAEPPSAEEQAEIASHCCPDGWMVVPVMPTTEMVNAFANYMKDWYGRPIDYQRGADAWARVLAASPMRSNAAVEKGSQ